MLALIPIIGPVVALMLSPTILAMAWSPAVAGTNCGTLLIGSAHDKLKNTNISETQRLQHSNGKKQPSQIGYRRMMAIP